MRRLALIGLIAGLAAAAPAAAAPSVPIMVVGKERVLRGPTFVPLRATTIRASGKRCSVLGSTPMAVLSRARLALRIRDLGSCGRDPRDAGAIYVSSIGGEREAGRGGWVYKVGRKTGTTSAGDPSGPFGTGRRLRSGQRVLWFWCELTTGDACQRTLEATPSVTTASPGDTVRVTVRGYDDNGRGVLVPGAVVRLNNEMATTGSDGVATLRVPMGTRLFAKVWAEKPGMVRSFDRSIEVD